MELLRVHPHIRSFGRWARCLGGWLVGRLVGWLVDQVIKQLGR